MLLRFRCSYVAFNRPLGGCRRPSADVRHQPIKMTVFPTVSRQFILHYVTKIKGQFLPPVIDGAPANNKYLISH